MDQREHPRRRFFERGCRAPGAPEREYIPRWGIILQSGTTRRGPVFPIYMHEQVRSWIKKTGRLQRDGQQLIKSTLDQAMPASAWNASGKASMARRSWSDGPTLCTCRRSHSRPSATPSFAACLEKSLGLLAPTLRSPHFLASIQLYYLEIAV